MAMAASSKAVVTLPSPTQILITRDFDAPRRLVFQAWTTPALIRRWWAGDRGDVTSVEVDLRVGGRWRYVMRAHSGFEVAFHGVYREVVPDERLVTTDVYEGAPDAEAVTTVTLTDVGERTRLAMRVEHSSPQNRDMHLHSGMEAGMQESLSHLERVAQSLR